jgi:hypothetical protein
MRTGMRGGLCQHHGLLLMCISVGLRREDWMEGGGGSEERVVKGLDSGEWCAWGVYALGMAYESLYSMHN